MHTLKVIVAGLLLLGVLVAVGRFLGGSAKMATTALWFIPIWLIASVVNLWVGVSKAGYTVAQELPILVPVFGGPVVVALIVWKVTRA